MSLLAKADIVKLIKNEALIEQDDGKPPSTDKHIQPASIDITIGQIFIPPVHDHNDPDGQEVAVCNDFYNLKPASIALVKSKERLRLPSKYGGFVFPKNGHFALKAVLFTNFGHIDPGFEGHLKFTVINMGKMDFKLERGDPIAGVVLFDLSAPTGGYQPQHDVENFYSHAKTLPRVFLDIDERVTNGVKIQAKAEWATKERNTVLVGLAVSAVGLVVSVVVGLVALIGPMYEKYSTLSADLKRLEDKLISSHPASGSKLQ